MTMPTYRIFIFLLRILQELPEGRAHDSEWEPGWRTQLLPQLLLRTPATQVTKFCTSVSPGPRSGGKAKMTPENMKKVYCWQEGDRQHVPRVCQHAEYIKPRAIVGRKWADSTYHVSVNMQSTLNHVLLFAGSGQTARIKCLLTCRVH